MRPLVEPGQPLLRERQAREVAAEPFEPEPVIGADVAIGVEVEALEVRVPRATVHTHGASGLRPTRNNGRAGAVAECRATADGGGAQLCEHGRIGGERATSRSVGGGAG